MAGEGVSAAKSGRFDECYNTETTLTIPAYGLAEVVDGTREGPGLKVRRPTGDGLAKIVVVGSAPVPPLSAGQIQVNQYLRMLVTERSGETVAAGDSLGSETDEFSAKRGNSGFTVIESPDSADPPFVAMVMRAGSMAGSSPDSLQRAVVNAVSCDALGQIVLDYTQVYGPLLTEAPTGTNVIDVTVTVDAVATEGREVVITLGEYEYRGTTDVSGEVHFASLPGGAWVVTVVVGTGETGETKGVELPPTPTAVTLAVTT